MKTILYIGGFEMPNKNAAAQRVLSVAKALRESDYTTFFYGVTKSNDYNGTINGFEYEAQPYPRSIKEWIGYAKGDNIIDYINSKAPDYVFTYNYPAIAQEKVIKYCHKKGIKVVGDITEWYMPTSLVKKIDTALRMRWSNNHLDGIIAISGFLATYYSRQNKLQLPPLIDKEEEKWKQKLEMLYPDKIKLIYAGQPSITKDRLDYIVNGIAKVPHENLIFHVIGVSKDQYFSIYGENSELDSLPIVFQGRLPHNDTIKLLMESDFQIFFRPDILVNNAGFPTKFVEASTAGVPVIMNRISNVGDYLVDGLNGFLISKPKENDIQQVLEHVSKMTREDIDKMKININKDCFDYRRYVKVLSAFVENL